MNQYHFFLFDQNGNVSETDCIDTVAVFNGPWAYSRPTKYWYFKEPNKVGWTRSHSSFVPIEIQTKLLLLQ